MTGPFPARHRSRCRRCAGVIEPGQLIRGYTHQPGHRHARCAHPWGLGPDARERQERAESAVQRLSARLAFEEPPG
jgi:hypothetical protein